jgi:Putative lumazine-binding
MKKLILCISILMTFDVALNAQTLQDTLDIKRVALAYIESQHTPNPEQMKDALHPRLVKRTFWKDKVTQKEYVTEYFAENMVILAEKYNVKGDKFPKNPKKELKLLDISDRTASIKLIADDWIDYMHLTKVSGKWQIINVLWQYHDSSKHQ